MNTGTHKHRVVSILLFGVLLTVGNGVSDAKTIKCAGKKATIVGTQGSDEIVGTAGDDVIAGRSGRDVIDGGGGNDIVCGGKGPDKISTGDGADKIFGGRSRDTIDAGDGANVVLGGRGNDIVVTGEGDDLIDGGFGNDLLIAGAGFDNVTGNRGRDRCVDAEVTETCEVVEEPEDGEPILSPIGNMVVSLGDTLEIQLSAIDSDGDTLTFSSTPLPLPANATLGALDGVFTFRPIEEQVGELIITFVVTDGTKSDSETIVITVIGPTPGGETSLSGKLLDTNDFVDGVETPVAGATISILGSSETAISDDSGEFLLTGIPSGPQVLDIDSQGADVAPDGSAYSGFRERIDLIDGVENVVSRPFFLPRIEDSSSTTVDPSTTTIVSNARLGVTLTIQPFSAIAEDGSNFTGDISISEVPEALAPAALPEFLEPGLLITIQPVGVVFFPPAPITFPNIDELPPGTLVDLWSLDPNEGNFSVVGTLRVTDDGEFLETIEGGIRAADWHGPTPQQPDDDFSDENEDNKDDGEEEPDCSHPETGSRSSLRDGRLIVTHDLPGYRSMGQMRSLRFVYNSTSADPQPIIGTDTTIQATSALPVTFSTSVRIGGVEQGVENFTSSSGLTQGQQETVHIGHLFDAKDIPTGIYPYRLRVAANYNQTTISALRASSVLINNERNSPIGAGWTIDGIQRITRQPGIQQVVLREGDGRAKVFIPQSETGPPSTDLALVMDGSGSISSSDFNLQREGYALAIEDPGIVPTDGSVAVTVVQFADGFGSVDVPFTVIDSEATAANVAAQIRSIGQRDGGTPLAEGVSAAIAAVGAGSPGARKVMCVSTDGVPDDRQAALDAADAAVAAGFDEIDGLAVGAGADVDFLDMFVRGGFVVSIGSFAEFSRTISEKLRTIIGGSPPGDFSVLEENGDGTFTRTLKDGTTFHFDADGLHLSTTERTGQATSYEYDGSARLTRIQDPAGLVTTLTYGSSGNLSSITEPTGKVSSFEHDDNGCLTKITDVDGEVREFGYDGRFRLVSQKSKRGLTTAYKYDEAGRSTGSELPDGTEVKLRCLNSKGTHFGTATAPSSPVRTSDRMASLTDGDGNIFEYGLDRFGRVVEVVDPLGNVSILDRDSNGLVTRIAQPNGVIDSLTWDDKGNLLESRSAQGTPLERVRTFTYDAQFSQPLTMTDALGRQLSVTYDNSGRISTVTKSDGSSVGITYAGSSFIPATVTDASGAVTSFDYDAAGRLVSTTFADGSRSTYTHDDAGNVTSVTRGSGTPDSDTTLYTYDDRHRLTSRSDKNGFDIAYTYDEDGLPVAYDTNIGAALELVRDDRGRISEIRSNQAGAVERTHTSLGDVSEQTDAVGATTRGVFNAAGQLIEKLLPGGAVQGFAYDANGHLTSFSDGLGNTTSWVIDELGRIVARINALGETCQFEYDLEDNLTKVLWEDGGTTNNFYDDRDFLTSVTTDDDDAGYEYDANGRLVAAVDSDSEVTFAYDDRGRLIETTTSYTDGPGPLTITYTYDDVGSRVRATDSLGTTTQYSYVAPGKLDQIASSSGLDVKFVYDASGQQVAIGGANGSSTALGYDATGRLMTLTYSGPSVAIEELQIEYDPRGLVARIDSGTNSRLISYDDRRRITAVSGPGSNESYVYDEAGNRTSSHNSSVYTYGLDNRLSETEQHLFSFDARGRLQKKTRKEDGQEQEFVWNERNQLVDILIDGVLARSYRYDALGRRISETSGGESTWFVYDGWNLYLEFDGNTPAHRYYSEPDESDVYLGMDDLELNSQLYFLTDHIDSIRYVTDEAGTVVTSITYDAFGQPSVVGSGLRILFAGLTYDAFAEIYNLHFRQYDPSIGRFLTRDPAGLVTGENLYIYAHNDPLNRKDAYGLQPKRGGRGHNDVKFDPKHPDRLIDKIADDVRRSTEYGGPDDGHLEKLRNHLRQVENLEGEGKLSPENAARARDAARKSLPPQAKTETGKDAAREIAEKLGKTEARDKLAREAMEKTAEKAMKKGAEKVGKKIACKAIPFVGPASLALDLYDLINLINDLTSDEE